jgi:multicomponent Na+:H+ antiporter subunit D
MPYTMAAFGIAALSMIGIPPTAGFFSKWYLLTGAWEARNWPALVVLLSSSLLSVVYFFRIFEAAYLQPSEAAARTPEDVASRQELPASMLLPILALALLTLVLGAYNQAIVNHILQHALPEIF